MSDWFQNRDWRGSKAHLLLLSKFRNGDSAESYADALYWESALGERPLDAINRLLEDGLLEVGGLPELVDYRFKTTDLRGMLKARRLKVSGNKGILVQRLIENDLDGMREATKDLTLYRCTPEGGRLAEQYLAEEEAIRVTTEKQVLVLLRQRDLSSAIRRIAEYEESRVFPRGIGLEWTDEHSQSETASLKTIFERTPAILTGLETDSLN